MASKQSSKRAVQPTIKKKSAARGPLKNLECPGTCDKLTIVTSKGVAAQSTLTYFPASAKR